MCTAHEGCSQIELSLKICSNSGYYYEGVTHSVNDLEVMWSARRQARVAERGSTF